VPVLGYLAGVLLHMLWNGGVLVIEDLQGEGATIWSVLLLEVPLFVLPPLAILYVIARRGASTELAVMREQLREEVGYGVITQQEYAELTDGLARKAAMRRARKQGWAAWKTQRAFYEAAGDLAYRKHHLAQGERVDPEDREAIVRSRGELARLRPLLAGS
jgi:hypothetical protein